MSRLRRTGAGLRRAVEWLSLGDRPTAIAMGLLVFYYAITWGPWQGKASGDGWFGFLYLKSIFYFHTLDMRHAAPEFLRFFGELGPGHHMPNRCPFGPVLLWFPFYLLVAIPESILLWLGVLKQSTLTGQSPLHIWVTGLANLGAVLVGWRQTLKLLQRHVPLPAARLGAVATVLATPLLWYTAHQPFYQHAIAFLCIAVFFEHWERTYGELGWRRFAWLGLVLGYAVSVRAQEIVYVLPLAIEIVIGFVRGPRRGAWLRAALVSGGVFVLACVPQMLVWLYYSGRIAPVQAEPIRWREPWPLVVLFSSRAGLFTWTPVAFLGAVGLVRGLARRDGTGRLVRQFGLAFLVGFYVVACAWVVAGAFAFGARRLSDAMGLVGLGVALLAAASPRALRTVRVLVLAAIVLNVGLMQLLRAKLITSPGSATRSLAGELENKLDAPRWLVGLAAKLGWPFCHPASAIWSVLHHVEPATFEAVVGELVLERDGQWLTVINRGVELTRQNRFHVASGLRWPDKGRGRVTGKVRIPLYQFATEPVQIDVIGDIRSGPIAARYNGAEVGIIRQGVILRMPRVEARAGYDELELELPLESELEKLEFTPLQPLRRPSFP